MSVGYHDGTAGRVLAALTPYQPVNGRDGKVRFNAPWRNGSDSHGVTLDITDAEHGAYYDAPADAGGSLYELAARLGIDTNKPQPSATTGKTFADLAAFAEAHYAPVDAYKAAGWKDDRKQHAGKMRPAVRFTTDSGYRWRFLDGEKPKYLHGSDYTASWYGLDRAIQLATEQGTPLVLCNGEASTVAAQWWNVPAACISGGAEREIPEHLLAALKTKWHGPLIIALDSDDKGRKAATKLHAQLTAAGYQVRAVDLGGGAGFDLADYCGLHQYQSVASLSAAPELTAPGINPIKPLVQKNVPVFPTNALPSWARAFVEAEARGKQTPADLQGSLVLAVLSTCLARCVTVEVNSGWREPVNLFTAVALPPSANKSGSFKAAIAPIAEHEQTQSTLLALDVARSKAERELLEERIKQAKAVLAKAKPGDEDAARDHLDSLLEQQIAFDELHTPRLIMDDATVEAIAGRLMEQRGRIAVLSPEADPFNIIAGRYTDAPNFDVYLRGHAGDDLRIDRKGQPAKFLKDPAVTMGVAVQPEVFQDIAKIKGAAGRGFLGRILYAVPRSIVGFRDVDAPPAPEAVVKTYHEAVLGLLKTGDAYRNEPLTLTLTPEARVTLQEWRRWIEPQLRPDAIFGHMTDWAGKLTGAIIRMAGLLHMAESVDSTRAYAHNGTSAISRATLQRAIAIGLYYAAHARVVFHDMRADSALDNARAVLRHLEKMRPAGEVSARDIYQRVKGGEAFKNSETLAPVLELLADHGYLLPVPMEARTGAGRKPSPKYTLHPQAFAAHETTGDGSITSPFTYEAHGETYERGYRSLDSYDTPEADETMSDDLFSDEDAPRQRTAHTPGLLTDAAARNARNNEWAAQHRLKQARDAARRKLEAAILATRENATRRAYDAFEEAVQNAADDAAVLALYEAERVVRENDPAMLTLLDLWYAEIQAYVAYIQAGGTPDGAGSF